MTLAAGAGADVGPDELSEDGDGQDDESDEEDPRLGQLAEIDAKSGSGKEHRSEDAQRHLLEHVAQPVVEALDLADEDAGDEGAEDSLQA